MGGGCVCVCGGAPSRGIRFACQDFRYFPSTWRRAFKSWRRAGGGGGVTLVDESGMPAHSAHNAACFQVAGGGGAVVMKQAIAGGQGGGWPTPSRLTPPPHLRKQMKSMKGARDWRPDFGTQPLFRPLTPPHRVVQTA